MAIATAVQEYLEQEHIGYDVVTHVPTLDAVHTAEAAHVPYHELAKAVVLEDDRGYLLAVIPASRRVDLHSISQELGRELMLADEVTLAELFADCELGSIPPLGPAYSMDSVVDSSLVDNPNVYFEGGDHFSLIHVTGREFRRLVANSPKKPISREYDSGLPPQTSRGGRH